MIKLKHFAIILLVLALTTSIVFGQKDSVMHIAAPITFSQNVVDFTTDNMGNIYLLNTNNQVKKLDNKGDSVAVYNDVRRYGKIHSIDASNPLKILVYYKDFSTILILDRLLNVRNTLDLRKQNIALAKSIASSYDGNIWLFDELDNNLKKIDDNGKVLLKTPDFRQVFNAAISPNTIADRDGLVYLYDSTNALVSFDYYGALKNNFKIKSLQDLQVIDKNSIVARSSSSMVLYKPATLQMINFSFEPSISSYKKMHFSGNKLYILDNANRLMIYKLL